MYKSESRWQLSGHVDDIDIVRSVFFGLIITPWAVYFLSVVVDQLEESRQRLSKLVLKLKDMRSRDQELNLRLQQNIAKLNLQIEERIKAEEARKEAINDLENEVYQRERTQVELAERTALLRSLYRCFSGSYLLSKCGRNILWL